MAGATPQSLPQRPKGAVQGKVARKAGRMRSVPLRYRCFMCFLSGERPHPSFDENASFFTEIHLPLNQQLRYLGKALGRQLSSAKQYLNATERLRAII